MPANRDADVCCPSPPWWHDGTPAPDEHGAGGGRRANLYAETSMTVNLQHAEFTTLRQAIAWRGTARMVLVPVALGTWAALSLVVLLFVDLPIAALFTLAVLAAGFEAIHALHVGAERIGRFLQVYYEHLPDGPRWETAVTSVGPGLPGGGIDPLFSFVFAAAVLLNMLLVLTPGPSRTELGVTGIIHLAFVVRLVRARGASARQRAVELESFKAVRERQQHHDA